MSTDTKLQIASLLRTDNQRIILKIPKVQFQKRASDCGAYAITFTMICIAYGNNPSSHEYEQTKLQSHFLETISIKANKAREAQIENIYIYSARCMPAEADIHMAQCTICK